MLQVHKVTNEYLDQQVQQVLNDQYDLNEQHERHDHKVYQVMIDKIELHEQQVLLVQHELLDLNDQLEQTENHEWYGTEFGIVELTIQLMM